MLLTSIFFTLTATLLGLFLIPSTNTQLIRVFSLFSSALVLFLSCGLLVQFDCNSYYFQSVVTYTLGSDLMNLTFSFGLDGISIFFFVVFSGFASTLDALYFFRGWYFGICRGKHCEWKLQTMLQAPRAK